MGDHGRHGTTWTRPLARAVAVFSVLAFVALTAAGGTAGASAARLSAFADWPMGGHDVWNTRSNPFETTIGVRNVDRLQTRWTFTTQGNVSATPAVVGDALYFPDWGGWLHKVDRSSGRAIWSRKISDYNGIPGSVSRTSPVVVNSTVYVGDLNGGNLMAVSATTGNLRWIADLEQHPLAILTQSPVVFDGVIFQGVSSSESPAAANPQYPCCTFRGSIVALDARTGAQLWKTYTVPDNGGQPGGYSGAAVWGGTPVIDPLHGRVVVTTGNNYTVPEEAKQCQLAGNPPGECLDPDDHVDSILALDLASGAIEWAQGVQGFDDWNNACIPGLPPNNCPINPGPDYDISTGPQLFPVPGQGLVVGAGSKSGIYWALDAASGRILWSAAVSPGSSQGGIMFGTATDFRRIYVASTNFLHIPHTSPSGQVITTGSLAALDPATGRMIWQVADPAGSQDRGAVSATNGVLYAGNIAGWMYAFDAETGALRWSFRGQGSSHAGPAISGGNVFWGNGYTFPIPGLYTPSTTFYAFSLDGR